MLSSPLTSMRLDFILILFIIIFIITWTFAVDFDINKVFPTCFFRIICILKIEIKILDGDILKLKNHMSVLSGGQFLNYF